MSALPVVTARKSVTAAPLEGEVLPPAMALPAPRELAPLARAGRAVAELLGLSPTRRVAARVAKELDAAVAASTRGDTVALAASLAGARAALEYGLSLGLHPQRDLQLATLAARYVSMAVSAPQEIAARPFNAAATALTGAIRDQDFAGAKLAVDAARGLMKTQAGDEPAVLAARAALAGALESYEAARPQLERKALEAQLDATTLRVSEALKKGDLAEARRARDDARALAPALTGLVSSPEAELVAAAAAKHAQMIEAAELATAREQGTAALQASRPLFDAVDSALRAGDELVARESLERAAALLAAADPSALDDESRAALKARQDTLAALRKRFDAELSDFPRRREAALAEKPMRELTASLKAELEALNEPRVRALLSAAEALLTSHTESQVPGREQLTTLLAEARARVDGLQQELASDTLRRLSEWATRGLLLSTMPYNGYYATLSAQQAINTVTGGYMVGLAAGKTDGWRATRNESNITWVSSVADAHAALVSLTKLNA